MPKPSQRSRTFRRVFVRVPSGISKLVYKKRKLSKTVCSSCGKELHGIKKGRPYQLNRLTKSKKRPERIFGGVLCPRCSRKEIIKRVREK